MNGNAVHSLKDEIRKQVLAKRNALSAAERNSLSSSIIARVLALDVYHRADCVMAYVGFGGEIETMDFIADVLARGKKLVLPRVVPESGALGIHVVSEPARQLEAGVWGIRQPRPDLCPVAPPSQVEFVLVPGVAFTRSCERLGYGRGYYDGFIRGLGDRRPALVAAAFSLQVLPGLPVSDRDQRVDLVVTESGEYRRSDS